MQRNNKIIHLWFESRAKILEAMEEIAKTVWTTLWVHGRNVILDNIYTEPTVTNDWITVLNEIFFADRIKNLAAAMMKRTSAQTNRQAWDWTTTTAILARAIVKEWLKYIENGVNPFRLNKAMTDIGNFVVDYVKDRAKQIENNDDLIKVATISSQDSNIWKIIWKAFELVGDWWSVNVEESTDQGIEIELRKWLEFAEPIKSEYFFNSPRFQYESENCHVLVTDKKLISMNQIAPVLDELLKSWSKDIFVVCDDMDPSMVAALIANKLKWILNVWVVKAPEYWTKKENFFTDVCALTWATLISDTTGLQLKDVMLDHLGIAEKLISSRWSTLIVWWKKNEEAINKIVEFLKEELKRTTDDRIRRKTEERLAKLTWWIATIKVWFPTKMETENKRHKIEDAVRATKSAIQEWIIYWSWVSLVEWIDKLKDTWDFSEYNIAYKILKKALAYPLKMIMDNAWLSWEFICESIRSNGKIWFWYDINNWEYCDLYEAGIIDPVKVIRVALENAISLANMVLSSNAIVAEDPEIDDTDFKAE